jgi:thiol-disulfide isomerase/thioredoxin
MKTKFIINIIIIALLGLFFSCGEVDTEREARKLGLSIPSEEIEAFDISFETLDGERLQLYNYKGQVILLNLWATWCVPCQIEMPSMEKLYKRYKEKGFQLIAVNIEENVKTEKIKEFINDKGLSFQVGLDTYSEAEEKFFTGSIPISYLIDKEFNIVGRILGTADWSSQPAYNIVEQLLEENPTNKEGR